MSFDPVAYTGEDGDEYKIFVRKGGKYSEKNVLIDWTKDDHKMFSGVFNEVDKQLEAAPIAKKETTFPVPGVSKVCQNCGLKIVHKAVQEWEIDHDYLGGLGEMCQACVKEGYIDKSLFPF